MINQADLRGDATEEALILVGRDGHILGSSPCAGEWVAHHFGSHCSSERLPAELQSWLERPGGKRGQCVPFTREDDQSQLVVAVLHPEADGAFCLLLQRSATGARRRRAHSMGLTERQLEVLRGVARGKANKQIAADLNVEPATIKTHLEQIYDKLGVDNRAAAINRAKDLL